MSFRFVFFWKIIHHSTALIRYVSWWFTEIPKKAILQKISNLRRDRQHQQALRASQTFEHNQSNGTLSGSSANVSESDLAIMNKRQLILNTIEDLKRNLEDQSIELYGLNDKDD